MLEAGKVLGETLFPLQKMCNPISKNQKIWQMMKGASPVGLKFAIFRVTWCNTGSNFIHSISWPGPVEHIYAWVLTEKQTVEERVALVHNFMVSVFFFSFFFLFSSSSFYWNSLYLQKKKWKKCNSSPKSCSLSCRYLSASGFICIIFIVLRVCVMWLYQFKAFLLCVVKIYVLDHGLIYQIWINCHFSFSNNFFSMVSTPDIWILSSIFSRLWCMNISSLI